MYCTEESCSRSFSQKDGATQTICGRKYELQLMFFHVCGACKHCGDHISEKFHLQHFRISQDFVRQGEMSETGVG